MCLVRMIKIITITIRNKTIRRITKTLITKRKMMMMAITATTTTTASSKNSDDKEGKSRRN